MEESSTGTTSQTDTANGGTKRKRSPSVERPAAPAPPAKATKTHGGHLQINYLARQFRETLPLVSVGDDLPSILDTVKEYGEVLDRHESFAGNLGARLLGPILIRRFERLFDGPPRVLKCHGREGTTVTWLDVVEFARHKPEQFNLEKQRDGVRVCQFYTRQSRVEISEEDFVLISSGMPQKLIPPQPIADDEEKELGTLEIMEKNIGQVINLADQVSAKARQLNQRLRNRRLAIVSRKESEAAEATGPPPPPAPSTPAPGNAADRIGGERGSVSPTAGFVAVNARPKEATGQNGPANDHHARMPSTSGKAYPGPTASASTKAELLNYFSSGGGGGGGGGGGSSSSQRDRALLESTISSEYAPSRSHKSKHQPFPDVDYAAVLLNSASPVPIPNTPLNLNQPCRPSPAERLDDSGPHKAEMLSRMEKMQRGDRVVPPCDRCRRLHMDCLKNLTACLGCTKKHAKCSWKEVTDQELIDNPAPTVHHHHPANGGGGGDDFSTADGMVVDGPPQPVLDEELLGEDESEDERPSLIVRLGTDGANHSANTDGPVEADTPSRATSAPLPPAATASIEAAIGEAVASPAGPPRTVAPEAPMVAQQQTAAEIQASAAEIIRKRLLGRPVVVPPPLAGEATGFQAVNRPTTAHGAPDSPKAMAMAMSPEAEAIYLLPSKLSNGGDEPDLMTPDLMTPGLDHGSSAPNGSPAGWSHASSSAVAAAAPNGLQQEQDRRPSA